jgi:hypothetical protein
MILSVVVHICETWSLVLREEHRLRVSEKGMLRKISKSKRDEIIGSLRNLHHEKVHNLYSSSRIIRMIKSMRM